MHAFTVLQCEVELAHRRCADVQLDGLSQLCQALKQRPPFLRASSKSNNEPRYKGDLGDWCAKSQAPRPPHPSCCTHYRFQVERLDHDRGAGARLPRDERVGEEVAHVIAFRL